MIRSIALPLVLLGLAAGATHAQASKPLQAVLVVTPHWDATTGFLQRFERDGDGEGWRMVGDRIPVVVGRSGLGWGTGLHALMDMDAETPVKREGDGRAPAGVFALRSAFGYAPADSAAWVRLPYVPADASVECVDDVNSRHYNRRVDRDTIPAPDWSSHEELRRRDELYRWGVWVDHNTDPAVPGLGSCIFLHVWGGPSVPTSGCTAMERERLEELLAWLDPRRSPVLVQLPGHEYARLRAPWDLP